MSHLDLMVLDVQCCNCTHSPLSEGGYQDLMLCSLKITPSETPLLGSEKGHGATTDSPAAPLSSLCGHSVDFCLPTLYGVRHLPLLF